MSVACGIAALDTSYKLMIELGLCQFKDKLVLLQFLLSSCWVYYPSKLALQIFIQIVSKRNIQHDAYQAIV